MRMPFAPMLASSSAPRRSGRLSGLADAPVAISSQKRGAALSA